MFPQLPDRKIFEVFSDNQEIETANSVKMQMQALVNLFNHMHVINETDSDNVYDFENDISLGNDGCGSLKIDKSEKYMMENQDDLCTKLSELFQKSSTSGNKIRLKVRSSCLWEDTLVKMKRVNPDCLNGIVTVQFIGEPAVDEEGP